MSISNCFLLARYRRDNYFANNNMNKDVTDSHLLLVSRIICTKDSMVKCYLRQIHVTIYKGVVLN